MLGSARRAEVQGTMVHSTAVVDPTARIGDRVRIGPQVVIGRRSVIADGCDIGAGCVLADDVRIGADSLLHARVTIAHGCSIGARAIVHSGVVIGADGFGFAPDARGHLHAIAQLGGVCIGHDVSVGCNTTIDRGAIDDTVIEDGVKIDNLVQVGHNCRIGAHSIICGNVGLAGSSVIGRHCVLAGGSGVGGEKPVVLCDGVTLTACTVATTSIDKPGVYSGSILHNTHQRWKRNALGFARLDELLKRIRQVERRLGTTNNEEPPA